MPSLHQTSTQLEKLFSADKYVSFNDLGSIQFDRPGFWSYLEALFSSPSHFLEMRAGVKRISKLKNEKCRQEYNQQFIARSQERLFEIENKLLDKQQIEAVVACEDAQLVMAAAGSGKTLSLLAKVDYLVNELKIPERKVLTISFTKKSADELAERLEKLNLRVDGKTFHALGKSILGNQDQTVYDKKLQEKTIQDCINELNQDPIFAKKYNDFMLNYFTMPDFLGDLNNMKELVLANQSFKNQTLKDISLNKSKLASNYATFKGDNVRSKEEQIIANFLFINNISYEYEKPFPGYNSYKPDFTITKFGEPIYIEHQGIDRNGRTRPDIDPEKYMKKVKWSQKYHEEHRTKLIQTYSYEFKEGTVLVNLENRLRTLGAKIVRKQESEIQDLIERGYKHDLQSFNNLFIVYTNLLKTSDSSISDLRKRVRRFSNKYQQLRTDKFLEIYEQVFAAYQSVLVQNNGIDFADMIVSATNKIKRLPEDKFSYNYILVDEIQDLSRARFNLLKALLDHNPRCKIFAVGDDWQSIYRFAGSDMSLIEDFAGIFNRKVHQSVIEQTHRFNGEILAVSTNFIKQNLAQIQKKPYSNVKRNTQLHIKLSQNEKSDAEALNLEMIELLKIVGSDKMQNRDFLIISRYNQDISRLEGHPNIKFDRHSSKIIWAYNDVNIELKFSTMHSAKGLTCDHAIILNCNSGWMGLPAKKANDPVIQLLLAKEDIFPDAEERRLFYVAITRAKYSTALISSEANISSFVREVIDVEPFEVERHCPHCELGVIRKRHGIYGDFYGCSNYKYGCDYSENLTPKNQVLPLK